MNAILLRIGGQEGEEKLSHDLAKESFPWDVILVIVTRPFNFLLVIILMLGKECFLLITAPVEKCCFQYIINSICCLVGLFQVTFLPI